MKSIHFCTPKKRSELHKMKTGDRIVTIRTGWVPEWYEGDILQVIERKTMIKPYDDEYLFDVKIHRREVWCKSQFDDNPAFTEELERYGKKFHSDHIFFFYVLEKIEKKLLEQKR